MSAMAFREPNQVKWVGTRPGHNGEQVAKLGSAEGGTTIIHTVTLGKTFFLSALSYTSFSDATPITMGVLVRNGADVHQYSLIHELVALAHTNAFGMSYPVPVEIPAGYDICAHSSGATGRASACIHGWEE